MTTSTLLRHLAETLRALPAGSALALRHPDLPKAVLHSGVALPAEGCDGVLDPEDVPVSVDVRYWVIGATPQNSDRYFDLVLNAWRAAGLSTRTSGDARPRMAYTRTADGFGLAITQSVNGCLSVSGSTPPFDPAEVRPLPARIDQSRES